LHQVAIASPADLNTATVGRAAFASRADDELFDGSEQ
jgi:hypothetical protein